MSLNSHSRDIYRKLVLKLEERSRLGGVMGIMHWDQEVVMPKGSSEARSMQMAALAGVLHEKSTNPELGHLIDKLFGIEMDQFNEAEQSNINEAKREFDLQTKVWKRVEPEGTCPSPRFGYVAVRFADSFIIFGDKKKYILHHRQETIGSSAFRIRPEWIHYMSGTKKNG